MRFRRRITIILLSLIAVISASRVVAIPIVDQSNTYPVSGGVASYTVYENGLAEYVLAQTFTAGISGKLVAVDLALSERRATEDLAISIVSLLAGLPDLSVAALGMGTLTPVDVDNDLFSLESVDLTTALIDIVAGQKYAIVLSSATPLMREYDWLHTSH